MIDFEKYTKNLIIVLAVYFTIFLLVFLPFLPRAVQLNLFEEPFLWLVVVANFLPAGLLLLYFFEKAEERIVRFAIMISAFVASFLSVFFILPLQL